MRVARRVPWSRHGRDDRGSAVIELIPLSVVMFAFVALIIFAGRLNVAYAHVEGAARSAARMVSLDRDPAAETTLATAKAHAQEMVDAGSSMCESMGFFPTVTETEVTVEVTCVVDVSSAALIEVPGSMPVSGTATEPIDRFREDSRE
jgi:Flp pilus assembly protein TadG